MLWRFYINITGCAGITGYWSETTFTISYKEKIVFLNFWKHVLVVTYLPHLLNFKAKALTFLILFECKFLKFNLKVIFPQIMHGCFFKKSTSYRFCRLIKRIVVIRFITRIFCRCHSFSCYFYVHTQPLFCVGVPSTNINFHRWLFYFFFFFSLSLSGFFFRTIHKSQECRGRGRVFL